MKNKCIIIGTGQKNSILNEAFYEVINNKIENASFSNLIAVLKASKYAKGMYKNVLLVDAKDILFYFHIIF